MIMEQKYFSYWKFHKNLSFYFSSALFPLRADIEAESRGTNLVELYCHQDKKIEIDGIRRRLEE